MQKDPTLTIIATRFLLVYPIQELAATHFHRAIATVTTDFETGLAVDVAATGFIRHKLLYVRDESGFGLQCGIEVEVCVRMVFG